MRVSVIGRQFRLVNIGELRDLGIGGSGPTGFWVLDARAPSVGRLSRQYQSVGRKQGFLESLLYKQFSDFWILFQVLGADRISTPTPLAASSMFVSIVAMG